MNGRERINRRKLIIDGLGVAGGLTAGWFLRSVLKTGGSQEPIQIDLRQPEVKEQEIKFSSASFNEISPGISNDLLENVSSITGYGNHITPDGFAYTLKEGSFPNLKPYEMSGLAFGRAQSKLFIPEEQLLLFVTNDVQGTNGAVEPIAVYGRPNNSEEFKPLYPQFYSYSFGIDHDVPQTDADGNLLYNYDGQVNIIAIRSDTDSPTVNDYNYWENIFYVVFFSLQDGKLEPMSATTLLEYPKS